MQEREPNAPEQYFAGEKRKETKNVKTGRYAYKQADLTEKNIANKQDSNPTNLGLSSALNLFTPELKDSNNEQSIKQLTNKKKYKRKI
ncbi:hypothetical protein [Sanguibacteroides justesenii]|uniref:hypothetical protein n=1 Tax=Sanguibacteroides justesenii TaxID=1547597 RepID=UPI0034DAF622